MSSHGRRAWATGLGAVVASALLPCIPTRVNAESPPSFSGTWAINHSLSDNVAAKVAEVAGPDDVAGAKTFGGLTFLPRKSYYEDVERVNLRQLLLDSVAALDTLEIEQSHEKIKIMQGDEAVRIFYFSRASTGEGLSGDVLTRRVTFKGQQLHLESESGKQKTIELLTLVPSRNQLIHAIHYQSDLLKKPLDLKLLYDRATKAP
jgi:hypothetical protein